MGKFEPLTVKRIVEEELKSPTGAVPAVTSGL